MLLFFSNQQHHEANQVYESRNDLLILPWYDIRCSLLDDDEQPVVGVHGGLQLQLVQLEADLGPEVDVCVTVGDDHPHPVLHGLVEAGVVVFIAAGPVDEKHLAGSNSLVGGELLKCFVRAAGSVVDKDGGDGGGDEGGDLVEEEAVLHRPDDVKRFAGSGEHLTTHLIQLILREAIFLHKF